MLRTSLCALTALFILSVPARADVPLYTIESLGHVYEYDDYYDFSATGINNNGDVIGHKNAPGSYNYGVLYTAENGLEDISIPIPYDINDVRQIAGISVSDYWTGIYLDYVTGERELISPISRESEAYGINSVGTVVGSVSGPLDGGSYGHDAMSYEDGSVTLIGALADGRRATAYAINDNNLIVGSSTSAPLSYHPYHAFSATLEKVKGQYEYQLVDLGTLGGDNSSAAAVNNAGQIVGTSDTTVLEQSHAFLYEDGVMQDLGALPDEKSYALDINIGGVVVGYSYRGRGISYPRSTPVIWMDGELHDLESRIVNRADWTTIDYPVAINDSGVIVGSGVVQEEGTSRRRIYKLTPLTSVDIDIQPDDATNYVETEGDSSEEMVVSILGSNVLDATQIDPAAVRFGPAEAAPAELPGALVDTNADGFDDLRLMFRTGATGIACEEIDDPALTGEMFAGEAIAGIDSVTTPSCETEGCHP
jgi:probable HAF family extracellular repeat protein